LLHVFVVVFDGNVFNKGANDGQDNGGIEATKDGDFHVERYLLSMFRGMRFKFTNKLTDNGNNHVGLDTFAQSQGLAGEFWFVKSHSALHIMPSDASSHT
jgi:hypothetical protein